MHEYTIRGESFETRPSRLILHHIKGDVARTPSVHFITRTYPRSKRVLYFFLNLIF